MDPIKRTPLSIHFERSVDPELALPNVASDGSLSAVIRLVGSFDDLDDDLLPDSGRSLPDWSGVIERVHQAAAHVRDVEAQAREQDLRVQELLQRAQDDVNRAAEHVRSAEARAVELQAHSKALLKAADARVKAAEERARIAEGWLAQVHHAIVSEFGIETSDDLAAR